MTTEVSAFVDHKKIIGPGVSVCISGVPAHLIYRTDAENLTLYDGDVAARVIDLLMLARERMEQGETSIRLDYADMTLQRPKRRVKRSVRAAAGA